MDDFPQFDDVGSFPLPETIDKEKFNEFYWLAYKALVNKSDIFANRGIQIYFIEPLLNSFKLKLKAGVQIINYPQHMDMYNQFLKPINNYESEPSLINPEKALIPEVIILEEFAKKNFEETGRELQIKVCITGPIDLYIKQHKFTIYSDLALNYSKSINVFLKNSMINNKYIKTPVISIDEPSFGYVDLINIDEEQLIKVYDQAIEGIKNQNITTQLHIHTLKRADIPLKSKNYDVITCEYAADKTNKVSKKLLDQYDKFIRVGITRTNIDNIIAEAIDLGSTWEQLKTFQGMVNLIDSKESIKKNLLDALKMYGDRLRFVGPDCGLGGWRIPEVAFLLLNRTSEVIKEVKNS